MEQKPIQPGPGQPRPGQPRPGIEVTRADRPDKPGRGAKARKRAQEAAPAPARNENRPAQDAAASPAFHVLLERLSRSARELQEKADAVERPSDLAGAVGRAKASLDDALSLGEELLEAWRAEQWNTNPEKSDR